MARWLKTDGEKIWVNPKNGRDFTLEELHEFVGGYIQLIGLDNHVMVVNDNGISKKLTINIAATIIYEQVTGNLDPIVGNVLICLRREVK